MSLVYRYPHCYALAYRWHTREECHFLETCLRRYAHARTTNHAPRTPSVQTLDGLRRTPNAERRTRRILDLGCGAGRHVLELAARGYEVVGVDPEPAMLAYVREQAAQQRLTITATEGSLDDFRVEGNFDLAICLMDTLRFLLTDEVIVAHLRRVAACVAPGGLYITDFWIPRDERWRADEQFAWEQRDDGLRVGVEYLQHPDSLDRRSRTFEDELIFHVTEQGSAQTIRGGRTRTRLLLAEEFLALVHAAGGWEVRGQFAGFDLMQPYAQPAPSWRLVTVLRQTA